MFERGFENLKKLCTKKSELKFFMSDICFSLQQNISMIRNNPPNETVTKNLKFLTKSQCFGTKI